MVVTLPDSAWASVPAKTRKSDSANRVTVRRSEATGARRLLRGDFGGFSRRGFGRGASGPPAGGGSAGAVVIALLGVVALLMGALPSARRTGRSAGTPRRPRAGESPRRR